MIWSKCCHRCEGSPASLMPDGHCFGVGLRTRLCFWRGWHSWLNTAFFPCCEAFAAAFDDHGAGVAQSAPAAMQAHHADPSHTERARDGHESRCDFSLNAEPAINGEYAGLPKARLNLEWAASNDSASLNCALFILCAATAIDSGACGSGRWSAAHRPLIPIPFAVARRQPAFRLRPG